MATEHTRDAVRASTILLFFCFLPSSCPLEPPAIFSGILRTAADRDLATSSGVDGTAELIAPESVDAQAYTNFCNSPEPQKQNAQLHTVCYVFITFNCANAIDINLYPLTINR